MSELIPTQEAVEQPKNEVELRSFEKYEILEINAENLRSGYELIGEKTTRYARRALRELREEDNYEESLAQAAQSLKELRKLAKSSTFTTSDGTNHLERYLDTLDGFAAGTKLSPEEVALLQIEDAAGCQTLCVSNTQSGEIVAIHTEEDADEVNRSDNAAIGKRWIKLNLPDQKVEYCSYGGLCGYGYASGLIEKQGKTMFQAADILGPTEQGPIWANAMAFMLMDSGDIQKANELSKQITSAFPDAPIFNGGYVIHQIEAGQPAKMQTLEYGGKYITQLEAKESEGRKLQFGVNYPQDSKLQKIDEYDLSEDEYDKQEKHMMQRRQRRLELIARLAGRENDTSSTWGEQESLKFVHKILQKGRGDVLEGWFTGLSNDLVAQNVSVYASPEGRLHLIVRKGYSLAQRKMRQSDREI
jgi:hypothetical protein